MLIDLTSHITKVEGGLSFQTGHPVIEMIDHRGISSINGTPQWHTLFIYIRISTGILPGHHTAVYNGGSTDDELENARVLQKKFDLSGCWGGKNRVGEKSNWYEDKTLQNYPCDSEWTREFVSNSNGIPLHSIIWRNNGDKAVVLPEMILRRPGFDPRRVFMAPETIHYPIKRGKGISGTINVTLSLPKNDLVSDDLYLCYPGGEKAVGICDLTPLYQADKINLLILNKQGIEGWKFAMRFAARLRKENIAFTVKVLTGSECRELSLKEFRQSLHDQLLIVPEELSDDFGGSLNTFLESKPLDLISGVLGKGEALLISGAFCPEVAFYLATSIGSGSWEGRWQSLKHCCQVTLFADKYNLGQIVNTEIPAGVDVRSGNIPLTDAKQFVKDRDLVIFASQDMQSDKSRCYELLKFCLEHDISVIVCAENADAFVLQVTGHFYELNCQLDAAGRQYTFGSAETRFGISFTLTHQGKLASCRNLSEAELNRLCDRQDTVQIANGVDCIGDLSGEQIHSTMFGSNIL
ncbi:MAG: hypothetical protein IJZ19_11945 [Lentisphaeria bacterium]|nr:hypothetical protein [Lentisphaeria bacterium]